MESFETSILTIKRKWPKQEDILWYQAENKGSYPNKQPVFKEYNRRASPVKERSRKGNTVRLSSPKEHLGLRFIKNPTEFVRTISTIEQKTRKRRHKISDQ